MRTDSRETLRTLFLGDAPAVSGILGSGEIVGGVTLTKNYNINPYLIRFPSLTLGGAITTPSEVNLYVNGFLTRQERLDPGEFQLRNVPAIVGLGNADIVIKDTFGRAHVISKEFYYSDRLLERGLRVEERSGRMVLPVSEDAAWPTIRDLLRCVFGIVNFSLADRSELELSALKAAMDRALEGREFASFRVSTRRAYKQFPLNSEEVNRELGAHVLERTHARVNLEHPEVTIHVEVLPRDIYFAFGREAGPGGLPVGVSGNVVALLSGGIDSPVAAHRLMKRGCRAVFVHFHSHPAMEDRAVKKGSKR